MRLQTQKQAYYTLSVTGFSILIGIPNFRLASAGRNLIQTQLVDTIEKYQEVRGSTFDQDDDDEYETQAAPAVFPSYGEDLGSAQAVAAYDLQEFEIAAVQIEDYLDNFLNQTAATQQPPSTSATTDTYQTASANPAKKPFSFWESLNFSKWNPFTNLNAVQVADNFFDEFQDKFSRSFHPAVQNYLTQYDRYGCWCYFDEESKYGKGPAQNGFDANCRILALGYRCVVIDAEIRGDSECIEPWLTVYNPYRPWLPGSVSEQCEQLNPGDQCAQDVCQVESTYSNNLFTYIMSEQDIDPDLLHSNMVFDPYLECNYGEYDFVAAERACCGDYQTGRVPYRPDGNQGCCGSAVYNEMSQCCEDAASSSVLPSGTC